ncbi:hypothetical protein [Methylocapsa sp. S129]|uniref:hypothetical protein n=1 Tax=Methylocapsa sp. S129 TaxID=1641869 RepID=UPI00131ABFC4|nr:hypothetical protein [Methylocapsa sp. S129]
MIRLSLGLVLASAAVQAASANDIQPPQAAKADTHCATLGEGFFPVAGSNACIKISGRISAGAGFGSAGGGSTNAFGPHFGGNPANKGFDTEAAASGDLRFDTAAGPGRVYVGVRKDTNPRWIINGQ